jgi:hypothetical protein
MKYLFFILMFLIGERISAQDSSNTSTEPPPDTSASVVAPVVRRPAPRKTVQKKDTTLQRTVSTIDSTVVHKDSITVIKRPVMLADTNAVFPSWKSVEQRTFFRFTDPLEYSITIKQWEGKEAIFYGMIALLIFFALIKNAFYRYIQDLFKTFFRTSPKQKQIRDQLLQSPLPSMLLNLFFLLSVGMFLALALQYLGFAMRINFWMLFVYCMLGLVGIYGIKFLSLKLIGWIFQVSDVIDGYIFIVFTTNKIIGIALLPFVVVLAFTYGFINQAAMNLSIVVVAALFAYRYFLSYISVRRQVNISFFHFLLYLCAFEVIPLLLINKLLFRFLGETS